jgi:hypothetical protein
VDKPSSYDEVMREVDEINDMLENAKYEQLEEVNPNFKFEHAFESITELNTFYRKRISNV